MKKQKEGKKEGQVEFDNIDYYVFDINFPTAR